MALIDQIAAVGRPISKGFLVMIAVAGVILVQPAWPGTLFIDDPGAWINPIGGMPLKYVVLFVMAAIGAAIVLTNEEKEGQWGYLTRGSLLAAFTAGILGTSWDSYGSLREHPGPSTRSSPSRAARPTRPPSPCRRSSRSG